MRSRIALLAAAAALACGPSGPETRSPGAPPADEPTPAPPASLPTPAPAPPAAGPAPTGGPALAPGIGDGGNGGATVWSRKIGGEGTEWAQGLAAAPDGSVVALTIIGVRGDALDQLGVVRSDASGRELSARAHDERGAGFAFPPTGSCAGAPSGNLVAAWTGRCAGDRCPTIADRALRGAAVVSFTAAGELAWAQDLPGAVLTNVAVGPAGEVAVGSGGAIHALHADGATRWDRAVSGLRAGAPLAVDSGGNVLWGRGGTVVKIAADGTPAWERDIASSATAVAIAIGSGDEVVVAGRATGAFEWAGTRFEPAPGRSWFLAALSPAGEPRWVRFVDAPDDADAARPRVLLASAPGGDLALVTEATGCGARAAMLGPDGAARWRRVLATGGCSGGALVIHGLAVSPSGDLLVAGSIAAAADLGTGPLPVQGIDGFVAELGGR